MTLLGAAALTRCAGTDGGQDPGDNLDFDVVIVGAGASGCVLANRLSADPDVRVLVIEAGGPAGRSDVHEPGRWTTLIGSDLDWRYVTEREPGLNDRAIEWPRGRVLGGSTSINAMAYVRGHRRCFDRWAEAAGPEWSYDAVLPYFKRVEDNSRGASEYLGAGGPLAVSDTTDPHRGHEAFLEAAREAGFEARPDWNFNGAQQEGGAGFYQKNIRDGRRESAATAFLLPVLDRPNLTVWPETLALRVVFDGTRAIGVECSRGGRTERARAARAVILSSGVIESPKTLMLSGIGPADALRRLGIPVILDSPGVGMNLHDHPRISVRWEGRTTLPPSSVSAGLLTWSARGPVPSPPDVQFYVGRGIDEPDPAITLTLALSQPRSRGSLTLRSADPLAPPVIRPNYFQDGRDLDAAVEAVRLALGLAGSAPYEALRGAPLAPGPGATSPDALRAFVRDTAGTIFHPAGTCRMGRDDAAVVDARLRVRGVEGLYVVDASVMPEVVNSQTAAACVMIADRASEWVGSGSGLA
jgi:choline dehydrogenase